MVPRQLHVFLLPATRPTTASHRVFVVTHNSPNPAKASLAILPSSRVAPRPHHIDACFTSEAATSILLVSGFCYKTRHELPRCADAPKMASPSPSLALRHATNHHCSGLRTRPPRDPIPSDPQTHASGLARLPRLRQPVTAPWPGRGPCFEHLAHCGGDRQGPVSD